MCRTSVRLASIVFLALVGLSARAADDTADVFTDPAQAGPDFAVQGEYTGEVKSDNESLKIGVQVIALGEGKFRAVAHIGGLPGDGYLPGGERVQIDGMTIGDTTKFTSDKGSGEIRGGVIKALGTGGETIAEFKRIVRESPTLGMAPPEGAVVLFDGTTAEHFEGGQLTDDGLLMQGVTSKQKFGNCQVHLEFRTPFQLTASGQGRGNSGCYLQGRYEVQVLDSFGLEGLDNECGGIYSIARPSVNMCYPPLSWQTYDIDFTAATYDDAGAKLKNARMTVRHNGVVIHNDVECDHATTAAPVAEGAEPGPLYLQDHGNPVRYRNIWIVEKP
jgi:hypothetical protein